MLIRNGEVAAVGGQREMMNTERGAFVACIAD